MDIKELLYTLSELDCIGNVTQASDKAYEILSQYAKAEKTNQLNVIGFLKGKADYTIMRDAHIDQVGFVVTDIDDNGFLTVASVGGIDLRALPSRDVTVHGKEKITAVFCSVPPHLSKSDTEYNDITKIKLDTALCEKAKKIVSIGDYVTFNQKCFDISDDLVCGRSFDDRAGVVCLLELAKRLSGKELPVNVAFALSNQEELGLRGAITAAFSVEPDEAIAIDVDFGDGPDVPKNQSSPLSGGGIISRYFGQSNVSNHNHFGIFFNSVFKGDKLGFIKLVLCFIYYGKSNVRIGCRVAVTGEMFKAGHYSVFL